MDTRLCDPFLNSIIKIIKKMCNIDISTNGSYYSNHGEIKSLGVTSIISFSGKAKGRFLIDLEKDLALRMAENLSEGKYDTVKDFMVLASIGEVNNTIAGDAITDLNNMYSLSLRLAPPIVFTGINAIISVPKYDPVSLNCSTCFGNLNVNIAFEEGEIS